MSQAKIAYCEIKLYLLGVTSLKQKRSIIKSMLTKMQNQFNIANAEIGDLDLWQSSIIGVTCVSNSTQQLHKVIQSVIEWIESRYPDAIITSENTEIM